ncbi:MAG: hypothetical protein K8S56_04690 [Candidatus Cloacimonetes bacterium]|nr:hypothetical protein [Candidatus Cloacimonadota bacterium]
MKNYQLLLIILLLCLPLVICAQDGQIDTHFIIENPTVISDSGTDYLQWDIAMEFLGSHWALEASLDPWVKNVQFYFVIDANKFSSIELVDIFVPELLALETMTNPGDLIYDQTWGISVAQNQCYINFRGQNANLFDVFQYGYSAYDAAVGGYSVTFCRVRLEISDASGTTPLQWAQSNTGITNLADWVCPTPGLNYATHSGENAAISLTTASIAGVTDLYFSEISYNLTGSGSETGYVEILNTTSSTLSLETCFIVTAGTSRVSYDLFAAFGTVEASGVLLISNGCNQTTFETAWGVVPAGATFAEGPAGGFGLGNGIGQLTLESSASREVLDTAGNPGTGEQLQQNSPGSWETGSSDTNSTPGEIEPGQTLPVTMSSFTTIITSNLLVDVQWVTESESGTSGYNVHRGDDNNLSQAWCLTIGNLIPAHNESQTREYSFIDTDTEIYCSYYYWIECVNINGSSGFYGPVFATVEPPDEEEHNPAIYLVTELKGNHPNPFNPETEITFSLKGTEGTPEQVQLSVFNIRGQKVRTLLDGKREPGEQHKIIWNGRNNQGKPVANGVYYYKLKTSSFQEVRKMLLLK